MTLPVEHIQNLEITVTGIFRYTDTWPAAIHPRRQRRLSSTLVTGRFGLERADQALEATWTPTVSNPSSTPTDTKKATKECDLREVWGLSFSKPSSLAVQQLRAQGCPYGPDVVVEVEAVVGVVVLL